jgi:heme-degrading monooxygenase HmoA
MFVVNNRVWVKPEYYEMFEERFSKRAGQIDKQDGFVRMQILKPVSEQSPYVVSTMWESKSAFEQWVGSEDFKLAHQNPMPKEAFREDREGGIEQFDVVISTD